MNAEQKTLPVRVYSKAKNRILDDFANRVGGNKEAARRLGICAATFSHWLNFKCVPKPGKQWTAEKLQKIAARVAEETGYNIRDVFPLPQESLQAISEVRVKDADIPLRQLTAEVERLKLSYEEDFTKRLEIEEAKSLLEKAMKKLSHREREILKLRFGLNKDGVAYNAKEVGIIFKLSGTRIGQIESRAISKLRASAAKLGIGDLLLPKVDPASIIEPTEKWPSEIVEAKQKIKDHLATKKATSPLTRHAPPP